MNKGSIGQYLLPQQKYLGKTGLIVLIIIMNMLVIMPVDIYLPALPRMSEIFNAPPSVVNLTLVGFLFFMAIGVLLFGPLSDKYGRRKLLLLGGAIYVLTNCLCAVSTSIWQLIFFRVFQSLGSGCLMAVSTAMIKDSFGGRDRKTVLSLVQSIAVIGPMAAPFFGSLILYAFTWRAIFWILALFGAVCLIATVFLQETLPRAECPAQSLLGSLGRLFIVGKNKSFTYFLLIVALLSAPYAAYIAVCAYIYSDFFSLSNFAYSCFFAATTVVSVLAPFLYLWLSARISTKVIMTSCFIAALSSGVLLPVFGPTAPVIFFLAFVPFTLAEGVVRPLSMVILLEQQDQDTGSASSLINFVNTLISSFGMLIGGLAWSSFIMGLGVITFGCALLSFFAWNLLLRSKITVKGLN